MTESEKYLEENTMSGDFLDILDVREYAKLYHKEQLEAKVPTAEEINNWADNDTRKVFIPNDKDPYYFLSRDAKIKGAKWAIKTLKA